jgi:Tol biopolymer transport system component
MQLQSGQTLSHYRIAGTLGRGGMGEVYIAEDTRLGRRVALKILPAGLAADAGRRGRFEREAKAVAALNHPNIVTIHSIEESGGVHFLTMELVEGETLAQMIRGGGIDLTRLLRLALELAEAMAAAHRQGITHRDLKPDNIMLGADGRLKILDFGLAKLLEDSAAQGAASELVTREVQTEEGKIVGTAAYMSPEQAEGRPVDPRSDVFSLGIILYEMATGERPFKGDTRMSTISSILRDTPAPVTELNGNLPRHLGRIVRRCLAKDPERRYGNGRELYNDLLELKEEIDSGEIGPAAAPAAGTGAAGPGRRRGWSLAMALSIGAAIVVIATLVATVLFDSREDGAAGPGGPPLQAKFSQLTDMPGAETQPSLSPDGRMLVFASLSGAFFDIFFQVVGGEKRFNLTAGSNSDNAWPAFSPDGTRIAFTSSRDGGGLYVMGTTGESVRRLADHGFNPSWTPDGSEVLYSTQGFRVPYGRAGRGELRAVEFDSGEVRSIPYDGDAVQPVMSPHGSRIAFWGLRGGSGVRDIWTIPAAGGEAVPVTDDEHTDWNPVWSPEGGYLYYGSDRNGSMNIWRVPIDEETGRTLGPPEAVITGSGDNVFLTVAADGRTMAYVSLQSSQNLQTMAFDPIVGEPAGDPVPATRGAQLFSWPSLSPDGESIVASRSGSQADLYLVNRDGSDRRQLTDDPGRDRGAAWSPDGSEIAFYSDRSGSYEIWGIRPDGSGLRQITDTPGTFTEMPTWSPDGTRMAVAVSITDGDVETLQGRIIDPHLPYAEQAPEDLPPYDGGKFGFEVCSWSPDGRWLAGNARATEAGGGGVIVYAMETGTYERLTDFGEYPQWLPDSRRMLFVHKGEMFVVDRESGEHRRVLSLLPDAIYHPRLSRDGRILIISRLVQDDDVWLMTLQ